MLGGHIDLGEAAKHALAREIKEEIDADVAIGDFRGAIENGWENNCEVSLIFEVHHDLTVAVTPTPASKEEEHLAFLWVHIEQLHAHNLLPTPLIDWLQKGNQDAWASTMC